jgi:FKBP-type peptidyl-prolyl cis-trans isomerase 2
LSYFLNKWAQEHQSRNSLSGDRNINVNGDITNYTSYNWIVDINHETEGNIVLVDGQVLQLRTDELKTAVAAVLSNAYSMYIVRP